MPWETIQKKYGHDPRHDGRYRIRYVSSFIQFDVFCHYHEGYTWFLTCDRIGISNILLGKSPGMNELLAKRAAIKYLRSTLRELDEDLARADSWTDKDLE